MSDFGDMADRVSDLPDELERQHRLATRDAMEEMRVRVEAEVRKNNSVAREQLVTDVKEGQRPDKRKAIERSVNVPLWARYLEHGTGQRATRDTQPDHEEYEAPDPMPPLERILQWIIAKNIQPTEYNTVYGLAGAIQETIGMVGTYPHPFLRPVWFGTHGYRAVIRENKRAMTVALNRL